MGIQLNQMYVAPLCSPSRSALLTGKYPSNVGMQHEVIYSDQPFGLGLQEKTMANYMKNSGYRTYLIGKWHLGFHKKWHTPLFRGFDSHFGYYGPHIDYYNYSLTMVLVQKQFIFQWNNKCIPIYLARLNGMIMMENIIETIMDTTCERTSPLTGMQLENTPRIYSLKMQSKR